MNGYLAAGKGQAGPPGRPVAVYDCHDGSGNLLYRVWRYQPKDFRVRRPDGRGGGISDLGDIRPVLYRLPEVSRAGIVVVAEAEKDADTCNKICNTLMDEPYALAQAGYSRAATTNPFGAGKWRPEYTEALRGRK